MTAHRTFVDATVRGSPARQVRRVLAMTAAAWRIAPSSAEAIARSAPYGHVPLRVRRRRLAAAGANGQGLLAHSW